MKAAFLTAVLATALAACAGDVGPAGSSGGGAGEGGAGAGAGGGSATGGSTSSSGGTAGSATGGTGGSSSGAGGSSSGAGGSSSGAGGSTGFDYLCDTNWSSTQGIKAGLGPIIDVSGYDPHIPPPNMGITPILIDGVEYPHGVVWFSNWNFSWVEWSITGQYTQLTMSVRIDDYKRNAPKVNSEWACVNAATDEYLFLCRPPNYQNAAETLCPQPGFCSIPCQNNNPAEPTCAFDNIRVGAGGNIVISGDGNTLYTSAEFYAFGAPIDVSLDISGVDVLRIRFNAAHTEVPSAPYRNGLATPVKVDRVGWFDLIDLADAKLHH